VTRRLVAMVVTTVEGQVCLHRQTGAYILRTHPVMDSGRVRLRLEVPIDDSTMPGVSRPDGLDGDRERSPDAGGR